MLSIEKIKILRNFLKKEIERESKLIKLKQFNYKTGNDIRSLNVDLSSIQGHNIFIQTGCIIDLNCKIDSYTFIGYNTKITKTVIGRYCSIGNDVSIGAGEHPLNTISTSSFFIKDNYEELTKKDCILGNDVWIGASCVIRRGVKIGDGAIVGANSFVNKDIQPYNIVAGNPAKLIRRKFDDNKVEKILQSEWWNFDPEYAQSLFDDLE